MSLRYALIGLLAAEPASGYELSKRFAQSMAHVWPVGHGQIYPELARLTSAGLIEEAGRGPRGRRTYAATEAGVSALRDWMRGTDPDYGCRSDADLRQFFLWTLPATEAIAHLEQDARAYQRRRDELEAVAATVDWDVSIQARVLRLTLEKGLRHYAAQIDWAVWAAAEIAAGALDPGGPQPQAGEKAGEFVAGDK